MTVKLLKTGRYSFHPAFGPQMDFVSESIRIDLTAEQEKSLIADEWAEDCESKPDFVKGIGEI